MIKLSLTIIPHKSRIQFFVHKMDRVLMELYWRINMPTHVTEVLNKDWPMVSDDDTHHVFHELWGLGLFSEFSRFQLRSSLIMIVCSHSASPVVQVPARATDIAFVSKVVCLCPLIVLNSRTIAAIGSHVWVCQGFA